MPRNGLKSLHTDGARVAGRQLRRDVGDCTEKCKSQEDFGFVCDDANVLEVYGDTGGFGVGTARAIINWMMFGDCLWEVGVSPVKVSKRRWRLG